MLRKSVRATVPKVSNRHWTLLYHTALALDARRPLNSSKAVPRSLQRGVIIANRGVIAVNDAGFAVKWKEQATMWHSDDVDWRPVYPPLPHPDGPHTGSASPAGVFLTQ